MPTLQKTSATVSAVKETAKVNKSSKDFAIVELVRRQGVYTTTLEIEDVNQVRAILSKYNRKPGTLAIAGPQATSIEFEAPGVRKTRKYCLRLPNIKLEDLKKIGFSQCGDVETMYIAKD